MEKLAASLADAQVDLNPHQVEAALFAFRSPYPKGRSSPTKLGSERRLKPGFSCPRDGLNANGRFSSSSQQASENSGIRSFPTSSSCPRCFWRPRPSTSRFERGILIRLTVLRSSSVRTSSPARKSRTSVRFAWNLAVIDEAHRLRNVYKPTNKIGNAIKSALAPFDKLLLTATPLQNSLLELFGLVSIIDEHMFGDIKSFRSQFSRLETDGDFRALA